MELDYKKIRFLWIIAFIIANFCNVLEKINIFLRASEINVSVIGYFIGSTVSSIFTFYCLYKYAYKGHRIHWLLFVMTMLSSSLLMQLFLMDWFSLKSLWKVPELSIKCFCWYAGYRLLLLNIVLSYRLKPNMNVNYDSKLTSLSNLAIPANEA